MVRTNNTPDIPLSALALTDARAWTEHYLSDVTIALSLETVVSYRRKLQDFLSWWESDAPQRFCTDTLVKDYIQHREKESRSSRTEYLHFTVLRHWGAYLVTKGRLDTNPWQKITPPRQPVHLATGWLLLWEIKKLLQSFDQKKLSQHRDAVLCRIMLKTGARETELSLARIKDFTPIGPDGTEAWLMLKSKGKQKEEPVLLVSSLKKQVEAYLRHRYRTGIYPPNKPLFTTFHDEEERPMPPREMRRRITAALRRAGIKRPGITPLALRHTAGKQALAKRAPIKAIQAMLRHEDIRTTKRLIQQEYRRTNAAERYLTDF